MRISGTDDAGVVNNRAELEVSQGAGLFGWSDLIVKLRKADQNFTTEVLKISSEGYMSFLGTTLILQTPTFPASSTAPGVKGSIQWSATYIYVCIEADTWARVPIATW